MAARAGVVVTGTEVLTGRVADRNGPWLAETLRRDGVDVAHVVVVGDRPEDLRAALRFLLDARLDLVITSGGLGPTADDLTAEVVAAAQGRELVLDPDLERRVAAVVARLSAGRGWQLDPAATAAGVRKQSFVAAGGAALEPVGTAPGLVVPPAEGREGPPVLVLPGPPRELQGMWPAARAHPLVEAALAGRAPIEQRTLRLWGTPESELAATLRRLDDTLVGLEITTCLREGELEIVTRFGPDRAAAYDAFAAAIAAAHPETLFSPDGRTVDEIVTDTLRDRSLTVATAESCTAGLLAGRLADRPGASAWLLGGVVAYADAAKRDQLGVPASLLAEVGAVSEPVARAMAEGARTRLGADVGIGVTGIAGPGGATPDKPVGLVHLAAVGPDGTLTRRVQLGGSRADVRARTVVIGLHLLRELLTT